MEGVILICLLVVLLHGGCHWEQRSKEGRTHECPWADDRMICCKDDRVCYIATM
jgi:hypothetical protein